MFQNAFDVLRIEDASYGLVYMLKKDSIQKLSILGVAQIVGAAIIHAVAILLRKRNHMTVYARLSLN